jgi:hypothetical protein
MIAAGCGPPRSGSTPVARLRRQLSATTRRNEVESRSTCPATKSSWTARSEADDSRTEALPPEVFEIPTGDHAPSRTAQFVQVDARGRHNSPISTLWGRGFRPWATWLRRVPERRAPQPQALRSYGLTEGSEIAEHKRSEIAAVERYPACRCPHGPNRSAQRAFPLLNMQSGVREFDQWHG